MLRKLTTAERERAQAEFGAMSDAEQCHAVERLLARFAGELEALGADGPNVTLALLACGVARSNAANGSVATAAWLASVADRLLDDAEIEARLDA